MNTIYLDTETTGLDPEDDEIIEISVIDDDGTILIDTLCAPVRVAEWPSAERVNNISPAMCAGYPPLAQLIPQIQNLFDASTEIVIYNAAFDIKFLRAAGLQIESTKVKCAMLSYAEYVGDWSSYYHNYKWHRLNDAAYKVGHQWGGTAHRALSDTFACRSVWHYLRKQAQKKDAAKHLRHKDLVNINISEVIDLIQQATEDRIDDYLSDLTWQQRQKLEEDLNHWLVQWLNENAPHLGDFTL